MSRIIGVHFKDLPPGVTRLAGGVVIRRGVHRTSVYRETDVLVKGKRHLSRLREAVVHDQETLEKVVLRIWASRGLLVKPTKAPRFKEAAEEYKRLQMNTRSDAGTKDLDYAADIVTWKLTPIDRITRGEIAHWYKTNEIERPASAVRAVRVTRRILKWAYDFYEIDRKNPATGFRLRKAGPTTKAIDDLAAFKARIEAETDWKAGFYKLALYTGARRASLLGLRWRDIDLQHRTATFVVMKSGEPLTIPLNRQAIEVLMALPRTGDRVLPISKITLDGESWAHRCRSTFISAAFAAGVDGDTRRMLVGHSAGSDPHSGYVDRDLLQQTLAPASQRAADWLEAKMTNP